MGDSQPGHDAKQQPPEREPFTCGIGKAEIGLKRPEWLVQSDSLILQPYRDFSQPGVTEKVARLAPGHLSV